MQFRAFVKCILMALVACLAVAGGILMFHQKASASSKPSPTVQSATIVYSYWYDAKGRLLRVWSGTPVHGPMTFGMCVTILPLSVLPTLAALT